MQLCVVKLDMRPWEMKKADPASDQLTASLCRGYTLNAGLTSRDEVSVAVSGVRWFRRDCLLYLSGVAVVK